MDNFLYTSSGSEISLGLTTSLNPAIWVAAETKEPSLVLKKIVPRSKTPAEGVKYCLLASSAKASRCIICTKKSLPIKIEAKIKINIDKTFVLKEKMEDALDFILRKR